LEAHGFRRHEGRAESFAAARWLTVYTHPYRSDTYVAQAPHIKKIRAFDDPARQSTPDA
jgi:hypothetical protein